MINITGVFHDQRGAGQSVTNLSGHHNGNRRLQCITPTRAGTCIDIQCIFFQSFILFMKLYLPTVLSSYFNLFKARKNLMYCFTAQNVC